MRINEAYEHEPFLHCQTEGNCLPNSCSRIGTQCVDVSASVDLVPTVSIGTVAVACQGSPEITCVTNAGGASCTITMTQQLCVSVPVTYGVALTAEEPAIACADNNCVGCGCC